MNLDWGSERDLCPWLESFVIQPIFIEFLLCAKHYVNTQSKEQPFPQRAPSGINWKAARGTEHRSMGRKR